MTVKKEMKRIAIAALAALGMSLFRFDAMAANSVAATPDDIGKVIGKDGNIYATADEARSSGTTACAMIAYVDIEELRGLAIALRDIDIGNNYNWTWEEVKSAAQTWSETSARKVEFGTWRLPTADDFKTMFNSCGGRPNGSNDYYYGNFRAMLRACGAADVSGTQYWTSSEDSSDTAYGYNFYSGGFYEYLKTNPYRGRCCLEFDVFSETSGFTGDCRWKYDEAAKTLTIYGNGAMADYVYQEWAPWYGKFKTSITNVVIESGVENVGDCAFYACTALTDISLPGSVTNIGECAFYQCGALKDFDVPQQLISIGRAAFYCCNTLTTLTLPATVESIGEDAFKSCRGIADVYCRPNPENLSWGYAREDFKDGNVTRIHVRSGHLAAYMEKFGSNVCGSFVGDLPYDSYNEWAVHHGFKTESSGIAIDETDIGCQITITPGLSATLGYIDEDGQVAVALCDNLGRLSVSEYKDRFNAFANDNAGADIRLPTADQLLRIRDTLVAKGKRRVYLFPFFYLGTTDPASGLPLLLNWSTGETSWASKSGSYNLNPIVVFPYEKLCYAQSDKADGIANVFRYAFDKPTGDFRDEPLIGISFDSDGKPVIKTPKVVNTAGFSYKIESARDLGFSSIVASESLGSGTVTFDKSDEPRFFRLTATAR